MQKYYNKKYFSWQSRVGEFGGRANLSKFAKFIRPDHHVIDYGCGGGYLLKNIKCKEKIGIEINIKQLGRYHYLQSCPRTYPKSTQRASVPISKAKEARINYFLCPMR